MSIARYHCFKRRVALLVIALTFMCCGSAYTQVLNLSFDFNTPATQSPRFNSGQAVEVDPSLAFSAGVFTKSVFSDESRGRFGFFVGRQKLTVRKSENKFDSVEYTAFTVQGATEFRVVGNANLNLSAGLAVGLSFLTDSSPCNEIFCDLPESAVLFTPLLRGAFRISPKFASYLEARWTYFMPDNHSIYPFESGVVFAVGIELNLWTDLGPSD